MKNFGKLALAAAIILPAVLVSCKKGENDPFLSLRSRKARVVGEWTVSKGEGTDVNTSTTQFAGTTTTTTTNNWTYDGASLSEVKTTVVTTTSPASSNSSTTTDLTAETMTHSFEKDGAWKSVQVVTYSNGDTRTVTSTGRWNFTGGVGEVKNKEQIVVVTEKMEVSDFDKSNNTTSNTVTEYTGSEASSMVITLDELKNKEMIWKVSGTTSQSSSTSSTDGTWTLTQ